MHSRKRPAVTLFIHAYNVHLGGGKALLEALLKTPAARNAQAWLDTRMVVPSGNTGNISVTRVSPSIFARLRAEWRLARQVREGDVVLCFGNLPPFFKLPGHVVVFIQNRFLLENSSLSGFSWKVRIRLILERRWLASRLTNADQLIVQTPAMKIALESRFPNRAEDAIQILPFVNVANGYQRKLPAISQHKKIDFDFIYVASGDPHKNHHNLIRAWQQLATQGLLPSLLLTVDQNVYPGLCAWIEEQATRYALRIQNVGVLPHEQIAQLYTKTGALIYPSTFESFGLPLIEARQAGLPILASELDYVRDVVDPEQTFNPESPISIAMAVKRFLRMDEPPLPLLNAGQFMASITRKAE